MHLFSVFFQIVRHFYTTFSKVSMPRRVHEVAENFSIFSEAVVNLMEKKPERDEWRFAEIVRFIEKETDPKGRRGKGKGKHKEPDDEPRYKPTLVVKQVGIMTFNTHVFEARKWTTVKPRRESQHSPNKILSNNNQTLLEKKTMHSMHFSS